MPPSIPDRWISYVSCGKVIAGTRFICFKVPLKKAVQRQIKEIWDIKTLLETIPKLGAVIDLTNTNRYYNPSDLLKSGILHRKILMPGRVIPPEEKVHEFMDAVDEFLGKDCESLIGVHCTHGLNRTGYMVCRYMRDRMGFDAKDAIHKFEIARGYKIERENFIAHLIGTDPPPPDLGNTTNIVPKSPPRDEHHINGNHNDNDRRINCASKSLRDERKDRNQDSYHSGRYVRHPQRVHSRDEPQENSRYRRKNSSQSRGYSSYYRINRNSSDSDSSHEYDYRHDY